VIQITSTGTNQNIEPFPSGRLDAQFRSSARQTRSAIHGSTFALDQVFASRHSTQQTDKTDEQSHSSRDRELLAKKILLVEDETIVRDVVTRMLKALGFTPLVADNARHALSLLEQGNIDLLLSDVIMPDMRGPELFSAAREEFPTLDALFVSGYSEDVLSEVPVHETGVGFLSKPFTLQQLRDALAQLLLRPST